jgi:hypothetical protein
MWLLGDTEAEVDSAVVYLMAQYFLTVTLAIIFSVLTRHQSDLVIV